MSPKCSQPVHAVDRKNTLILHIKRIHSVSSRCLVVLLTLHFTRDRRCLPSHTLDAAAAV